MDNEKGSGVKNEKDPEIIFLKAPGLEKIRAGNRNLKITEKIKKSEIQKKLVNTGE